MKTVLSYGLEFKDDSWITLEAFLFNEKGKPILWVIMHNNLYCSKYDMQFYRVFNPYIWERDFLEEYTFKSVKEAIDFRKG